MGIVFLVKLFALQVVNDTYSSQAESNTRQRIVEYPFRGLIYDRNENLIVYNEPIYDLMVIPKDIEVTDTTSFCNLFEITKQEFEENVLNARKYSYVKPSTFLKKISHERYAQIQDQLYKFRGFYVNPRTVRRYSKPILANELGYIGEVDQDFLDGDTTNSYKPGDYIGITGLEEAYEDALRGKRGVSYKLVNVSGIVKGAYKGGTNDTASIPGKNLISTIDLPLQEYAEKLLDGKRGSVVAIEPSTGEILVMASAPTYDPNLLTGKKLGDNFNKIRVDTTAPLFNRPIMAQYPPGSIFKTVQALIALDEGVTTTDEKIKVNLNNIGDHAPPGVYDVVKGIRYSSNNYFYEIMKRLILRGEGSNIFTDTPLGLEKWTAAVKKFGFGDQLGIDIPGEVPGGVPDVELYDKMYGKGRYAYSGFASVSIGQGELLVTPLQVANLAAIIANRGHYIKPHLIKGIKENDKTEYFNFDKVYTGNNNEYYPEIIEGMAQAAKQTAPRAIINDIEIIGKTGTAENGKKDETLDHSVFMAFAPRENPQIAIAVYVENSGMGGRAAGMTASLIIEKYLRGYIKKNWWKREEYVLKGDFID
ncbi:MAG: peptidoglycan glycosyltransferase [Roseivirga sp.]